RGEVGHGFGVDVRLDDPAHLPRSGVAVAARELGEETEISGLGDGAVDLVDDAGVVRRRGQEDAEHLHDVFAFEDEFAFSYPRFEFRESFTQQEQQQRTVVGECASLHEARKGLLPLTGFAGPKIGVSFGIIDDDGDADLREMVMDRCAVVLECLTHLFVGLAVDNAVHQPDDGGCDCVFFGGSHWRVTVAWGIRSRLGLPRGSMYSIIASSSAESSTDISESLSVRYPSTSAAPSRTG